MTATEVSVDMLIEKISVQYRVEQFYYREAELLDEGLWDEWYQQFTPELRYYMPVRSNLDTVPQTAADPTAQTAVQAGPGTPSPQLLAFFDDSYVELYQRIHRLKTGMA